MALIETAWTDQWIAENYPNSYVLVEESTGEIVICLGENEEGRPTY
jgi:hypothetical protein